MGTASAAFNAGQQVGGAVGTALFNTVATAATAEYLRNHGSVTASTVHVFGAGLLVATGIMLFAALVATVLLRPRGGTHGA
ncbi:hypothetical protein [Streptomyces sp. NPDC050428]